MDPGFSTQLYWSHYSALMPESREARDFYVRKAFACGWDKRMPLRQIQWNISSLSTRCRAEHWLGFSR
ncbi:MAG: DUF1016 domain-containing protein [Pirellulaceae bacterium]|nr:DUF1016 domain-containing protein [Pirellulaceae bacterium]